MDQEQLPMVAPSEEQALPEEVCPQCGEPVASNDVYCPHCNELLTEEPETEAETDEEAGRPSTVHPQTRGVFVFMILVAAALSLLVILVALLLGPYLRHLSGA